MDANIDAGKTGGSAAPKKGFESERRRRLERAALSELLAGKRCAGCATLGAWTVYNIERTKGRTRYIKCRACGRCDQVTPIVTEKTEA